MPARSFSCLPSLLLTPSHSRDRVSSCTAQWHLRAAACKDQDALFLCQARRRRARRAAAAGRGTPPLAHRSASAPPASPRPAARARCRYLRSHPGLVCVLLRPPCLGAPVQRFTAAAPCVARQRQVRRTMPRGPNSFQQWRAREAISATATPLPLSVGLSVWRTRGLVWRACCRARRSACARRHCSASSRSWSEHLPAAGGGCRLVCSLVFSRHACGRPRHPKSVRLVPTGGTRAAGLPAAAKRAAHPG